MKTNKLVLATIAACIAATGAGVAKTAAERAQEKLSQYEKTGDSVSCVMLRSIRDTDILDDYTMLIQASGDMYLNELSGRCSGLAREGRYVHRSTGARMCKGDIIQVIDSFGTMRGSCSLGDFEKLTEIPDSE